MLQRIKKIYQSDNSQVLIGNVAASGFGLLIFMLLARGLTKPEFGQWTLFFSSAGLLDLLRTGLVRQAMVRAVSVEDESTLGEIMASSGVILTVISLLLAAVTYAVYLLVDTSSWALEPFFRHYPLLALVSIPSNLDTWRAHAMGKFKRMNAIRLYINIVFAVAAGASTILQLSLDQIIYLYLAANLLISAYSFFSSIRFIKWQLASRARVTALLKFGKHSLATMAGVNLLKTADTLIIGATLGTTAVATYAIPLKALDLVDIPLRGFVMTSFRKLSRLASEQLWSGFNELLTKNVLFLTAALMPLIVVSLFAPELITRILGGDGYSESNYLLMIFTIPMLLLPLDKFVGVAYDSIGNPKINAQKVWLMVFINIVGDFVVISFIGTLWAVAAVTIINIILGIVFGIVKHPHLKLSLQGVSIRPYLEPVVTKIKP